MSNKIKSFLYFASFVLTMITYSTVKQANNTPSNELAENTIAHVSTLEALK